MKNVTITNVFGSVNRGDALLVEALISEMQESLSKNVLIHGIAHFPELEQLHLPEVTWSSPPGRSYHRNKWIRRFQNIFFESMALLYTLFDAPSWFPKVFPISQRESIDSIKKSDLIISCPGGFLLDVNVSIIANLLQLWIAHYFKKRVIIAPQTIGPIRKKWLKSFCSSQLNKCEKVCVREDYSFKFLTQELEIPERKVIRMADMALYHKNRDIEGGLAVLEELGFSKNELFLGASVVNWPFPNSLDRKQARADYETKLADIFKRVYSQFGLKTLVVNQVSSDLDVAYRIKDLSGDYVVVDDADRSTSIMRGLIHHSQIFLGSRFHSCVFAMLENVPTCALAYTYKTNGIMQDLDQSSKVWEIDSFAVDSVISQLECSLQNRKAQSEYLNQKLSSISYPRLRSILSISQ